MEDNSFIVTREGFSPSTPILKRIMKVLLDNAAGRTQLAQKANVHYDVLKKHLTWLEQKQYIEYNIVEGKTVIRLTEKGRVFAQKLFELYD